MTPSEIGDNSQVPAATSPTLPVHTSPHPTDGPPPSTLHDIPPAATLSCSPEGTTLKDIFTPSAEPDIRGILTTPSTPTPTPAPETASRVLNESSTSCDAGDASASNPLLSASSIVGFSITTSPPLQNAEFFALDGSTPSCPTGNAALPRLRVRGLVNTGSMSL